MAEKQGGHRRFMEKVSMFVHGFTQIGGVLAGGAAVLLGLYYGHDLAMHDKNVQAWVASLGPIAAVGGLFLYDRHSQRQEIVRKRQAEKR